MGRNILTVCLILFVTSVLLAVQSRFSRAQSEDKNQINLGTFSPAPTNPVVDVPSGPIPLTTPKIGGRNGKDYCIDDEDPDMCDDNSSHLVPKGVGGVKGSCGTVIEWTHKLVDALPQVMKGTRNKLTKTVSNCGYSTGPASNYVSTFLVIDAYNLAGFKELSKSNSSQVSPSGLFSWWQKAPGYQYIPYSPTVVKEFAEGKKDLTGCVMFMATGSGYHIGIVNKLEVYKAAGDGVISILQSGTRMYIDRFPVSGWAIRNTSTNKTKTSGVTGFGCH